MKTVKAIMKWAAYSIVALMALVWLLNADKADVRWILLAASLGGGFIYITKRLDRIEAAIQKQARHQQ